MSALLGAASAVDILCEHDVVDYFIVISFRFSHGEFARGAWVSARLHIESIRNAHHQRKGPKMDE